MESPPFYLYIKIFFQLFSKQFRFVMYFSPISDRW